MKKHHILIVWALLLPLLAAAQLLPRAPMAIKGSTNLTTSMFKGWDGCGADANEVSKPAPCPNNDETTTAFSRECNTNKKLNEGDLLYGNAAIYYLWYADITGANFIYVEGTPGMWLNVFLNRSEPEDNGDVHGGYCYEQSIYIGDNGKGSLNLNELDLHYVHLNAIMVSSCEADSKVTKLQVLGYDPESPPDPEWGEDAIKKYQLNCQSIPSGVASFSGNGKHVAGETFTVNTWPYNEANVFKCWQDINGNVLSTNPEFEFTMPEEKDMPANGQITIYAVYTYNPNGPGDPVHIAQYTLTLVSDPLVGGYFSGNAVRKVDEASTVSLTAYANSGFKLINWTDEDDNIVGTESSIKYLMPGHSSTLTAHFTYEPEQPANPGTNLWDEENSELIIDFFNTGSLISAMDNMIGNSSNRSKVTSLIVEGIMNQNDFSNIASYYSNLIYLDLSRVEGITYVPNNYKNMAALEEIELPACITEVRGSAFNGCSKLAVIDCYALVPPTVGSNAFLGTDEDLTIFVPEQSMDLYKAADGWKDHNIESLSKKIVELCVNLLGETEAQNYDGRYKNLSLELINVKSGQKFKYVLTDRVNYTFPNLVKRTKYFPVVKNGRGQYASIDRDTITIGPASYTDEQFNIQRQQFTFKGIKVPQTLKLKVLVPNEASPNEPTDVTDQVTVYWFDEKKEYLAKGTELTDQLEDEKVYYFLELPETLGRKFVEPDTVAYTIKPSGNDIVVTLQEHPTGEWKSKFVVKSPAGLPIFPVSYSFTQKLNGKYTTVNNLTLNTEPEEDVTCKYYKGLEVEMTVQAEGFIPRTFTFMPDAFPADIVLTPATGPIATINFTWQEAVQTGKTAEVLNYYPDYENVSYSIFNKTKNVAVTQFTKQFPRLSLPEGNEIGDEISITVSSTAKVFNDVTLTATVATDNTLTFTFPLVERGGFTARFVTTDNNSVIGLLFDAAGTLINRQEYANFKPDALDSNDTNDLTVNQLEDGEYTLISMGKSEFFSSIFELAKFDAAGLKSGTDYVKNVFTIKSGENLNVRNVKIPLFEEEKFYYTDNNTRFTTNKSNVIQGNYLTFNTRVDFDEKYKGGVSEVELVYPLPKDANFVDGSLMIGKDVAMANQYQYVDNRTWTENVDANGATIREASGEHSLTVQMSGNWSDRVKFCIVPLRRGNYTPTAYVRFKYNNETITQPIGSPAYTVNDVTIWTPSLISTPALHVDGNAPALSTINVYDGNWMIGTTQALSDGYWSLEADLGNPTNLSMHQIRAEIITQEGYVLNSERRFVEYNIKSIQAKDVEMNFYNGKTVIVKFDLEHVKANVKSYPFTDQNEFVFFVNLTNNDPEVVHSCVVRVFTINHEWVELPAQYVEGKNWVAHGYFDMQHAPIGVRVNVESDISDEVDFDKILEYSYVVNSRSLMKTEAETPFTIDLETVGEKGEAATYFQSTLTQTDLNRYSDGQELALAVINGSELDSIRIYTSYDGSFVVVDPKDNGNVWGVNYSPNPSRSKVRIDYRDTEELKARINILSDLATLITPFTNRSYLEYLWAEAEKDVLYWEANPPSNPAQVAKQKAAITLEQFYRYAVLNVGEITQITRDINTLLSYARYGIQDVDEWQGLADAFLPCDGDENYQAQALSLNWQSHRYKAIHGQQYITAVEMATSTAQLLLGLLGNYSESWYSSLYTTGADFRTVFKVYQAISGFVMMYSTNTYLANKAASRNHMNWAKRQRKLFKCNYKELAEVKDTEKKWDFTLPYPIVEPIIDPAGFVYEGVTSNRLEGVTATAFYKKTYEDKWGDLQEEIVKWDAENYGQENPLYTDEQGMYQWDVPQGLWQVKFEKDGYLTAYSEWLPVPPPQMEVNVGMVQNAQPEVVKARAFEKGTSTPAAVEIEFSKYMQPETLDATTIILKGKNSDNSFTDALENLTISFPDLEESIEGSGVQYAKKVLVSLPDGENLAQYAKGVNVTVSSSVLSYAGIPMTATYSQDIDPEKRIESIQADALLQIGYEGSETLNLAALPTEAVANKKVTVLVKSASSNIATLTDEKLEEVELEFDEQGQAKLQVNGDLFGTTALQMQLKDDADVKAETMVKVLDPAMLLEVKAPMASRVTGSAVYRGETITLSCETEGAIIYYTTDGSCPCEKATRKQYKNAIVINGPVTVKAIAVGVKGTESELVEYNYTIRQTTMTLDLASEWNWASHNQEAALSIDALKDVANRVQTQTQETVYDPNFGFVGNITSIDATTGIKVNAKDAATINLSGDEFNPKGQTVTLYKGWNWIGYPVNATLSLKDALVYLNVEEGDRITNLIDGQAEFTGGQWSGTLQTLKPGQSYQYKSMSDKTFIYSNVSTQNARALYGHEQQPVKPWSVNPHHFSSLMAVTADVVAYGLVADADEYYVGAFVGDECRGVGKYVNGQLYITVYGNTAGEKVTFVAVDAQTGEEHALTTEDAITFQSDVLGSVKAPLQLFIGSATGITSISSEADGSEWYNLKGQRISQPAGKGLFIHGSKKVVRK